MDEAADLIKNLSSDIDDFALNLYSPIQVDSVDGMKKVVQDFIAKIITFCGEAFFIEPKEFETWGAFLTKALEHNCSKLDEALLDFKVTGLQL